jgi:hypothetical protein
VPAGHEALQLVGSAVGDDAAALEHRDAVCELVCLVEVLRGEQHRRAVADEAAHDVPHGVAAARVEARGRLVEEQHARGSDEGHREVEAPPHPAGVGGEWFACRLDEVELLEQVGDPRLRSPRAEVAEAGHEQEVLLAREQPVDRRELAGEADRGADAARIPHHVAPVDERRAAIRPHEGGEDVHGRGLACAVRAEQCGDGSGGDGEVDTREHHLVAVGLSQPPHVYRWSGHAIRSLLCRRGSTAPVGW